MFGSSCGSAAIRLSALVLLLSVTVRVEAIKCWDCSSSINPNCGDPFRNYSFDMIDCDQRIMPHLQGKKATLCRKIVQKIQDDPNPRIVRTCGWIEDQSTDGECVKRSGTFSILIEYCTCSTDGCNAATSQSLSALLTATALGLLAWLRV